MFAKHMIAKIYVHTHHAYNSVMTMWTKTFYLLVQFCGYSNIVPLTSTDKGQLSAAIMLKI